MEVDYVGVVDFLEDGDLSVGPLGVGGVLEGVEYFLKCEDLPRLLALDLPDVPVGARAEFFEDFVLL